MLQQSADRPRRVQLAAEAPFQLGGWSVHPGLRQISRGSESRTLEPRVMQVLVALAQAQGGIVGRDALVDCCWDGRIVGENAINRVISLLRAVGSETGAFEIETITKVGYRLKRAAATPVVQPAPQEPLGAGQAWPRRAAIVGIGATLAGGTAYLIKPDIFSSRRREAERHYRAGVDSERLGEAAAMQALAHYQAAVRADPNYAPAWGAVARALVSLRSGDDRQSEQIARQVQQASRRALQLDPDNADALLALVMIAPSYRNWINLDKLARQALARRPDLSLVQLTLALSRADTGRFRDAVALMDKARRRQPLLPGMTGRFAWLLWQIGRPAEAARIFEWAYRTWPEHSMIWVYRMMYLSFSGQTGEALRMAERNNSRGALGGPLPPTVAADCARALAAGANEADRNKAVDSIIAARRDGDIGSQYSIMYLSALGNVEAAFEQTYDYLLGRRDTLTGERQPLSPHADRETCFLFASQTAAMRADPRFPKLTSAIGLDDYWRATGLPSNLTHFGTP
ncbi:winged helix-turn-helix domain-containing protein [Sphingomonas tabacisoli]|uniref:Winged helix-turn-helix domain-containing protein n=1 Tax=Sphingomonas tabacisoli TaxID=2249466 RepID=A0ABW4I4C4_9SPHN